ncbi:Signal recognition particle protein [Rickettsiales bacterium Ac37b]|nr:Signal recognition particle protein [Rickettsiales bacterium Ac37b]
MFESLGNNFTKIFDKLTKRGILSQDDIDNTMREIRIALLEADVALPVVKDFIAKVKEKILGQEIVKSVSPGQMVIKLVQDHLIEALGSDFAELQLNATPPVFIMFVGLQGSGKTTTSAKLALRLKQKLKKKILLTSLDIYRPAAQQQLEILAKQAEVDSLPIIEGESPSAITKRCIKIANNEGYDIVILDTAGRLHIDDSLMQELNDIKTLVNPKEILLVVDSMTGQDAVNVAQGFHETLQLTGLILTRVDGDSRGGAALSLKSITNCPIKFLGVGEKLTELEEFYPDRIASRILDKGDVISLVERAAQIVDQKEAEQLTKKLSKGNFDLNDLASQIKNINKIGGLSAILTMLPGVKKIKDQISNANINEKALARQLAIIYSMTPHERSNPKILNASRKRRIALGSGMTVQDVNRLLKQYYEMSNMVKKFGKMDKSALLRGGLGKIFS